MTFNIGSQQGNINNVTGDQTIHGGQHGTFHGGAQLPLDLVARLRDALDRTALPPQLAAGVRDEVNGLNADLTALAPDRSRAADRLVRITRALTAAGALTAAAGPLAEAITALAQWLGPFGESVLRAIAP